MAGGNGRGRELADGKRRLIEAGIRLSARGRGLAALGLRELAREAELNPNTFYRHFESMDDLGLAAVELVTNDLRQGLADFRQDVSRSEDRTQRSAEFFIDFVWSHGEAFLAGVREYHAGPPAVRAALRATLDDIAAGIVADVRAVGLARSLSDETLHEIALAIVEKSFFASADVVEHPTRRTEIAGRIVRFARMLFLGAGQLEAAETSRARMVPSV